MRAVLSGCPLLLLLPLLAQVRYVAADDITLSPVRGRGVAVLSMIAMGDKDRTAPAELFALYAQGLENITKTKYQGVPHWGKKVRWRLSGA